MSRVEDLKEQRKNLVADHDFPSIMYFLMEISGTLAMLYDLLKERKEGEEDESIDRYS